MIKAYFIIHIMDYLKNKKVLITGASGFIGSYLTYELIKRRVDTRVLLRNKKGRMFKGRKVEVFVGDLLNQQSLEEALKGVHVIFNVAGALPHHKLDNDSYWNVNVAGVENLVKAAIKNKAEKIVHVSTVGIYGPRADGISENSRPNPQDVYAKSKLEGEKALKRVAGKNLKVVIVRPTIAYGPGDTRPGFLDLFKLIKKGMFVQVGNGENYFHTVFIENLTDALLLVADCKKADGRDFIVGDEPCPKMSEICNLMAASLNRNKPRVYLPAILATMMSILFEFGGIFGLPVLLSRKRVGFITEPKRYTTEKIKKELGFKPKVSLQDGIKVTADWYNKNNLI